MTKKITLIKDAVIKKRARKGWTMDEIQEKAQRERESYQKLNDNEPDALASGGDMSKILEEKDEDEE